MKLSMIPAIAVLNSLSAFAAPMQPEALKDEGYICHPVLLESGEDAVLCIKAASKNNQPSEEQQSSAPGYTHPRVIVRPMQGPEWTERAFHGPKWTDVLEQP